MKRTFYPARVEDNKDPDERGRLKVSCRELLGDASTLPMWVEPVLDWGMFFIPDEGEIIEIEVVEGSGKDETFAAASITSLKARWKGQRHFGDGEGNPATVHGDFKGGTYGKIRGFATPNGHTLIFDDTADSPRIVLTWRKGEEQATKYTIDADGNIGFSIRDGENSFSLNGSSAATIATVGDGAMSVAVAEHLETLFNDWRTWAIAHTHGTGVGPSGPPLEAITAPAWDPNIVSNHVKIPDTD